MFNQSICFTPVFLHKNKLTDQFTTKKQAFDNHGFNLDNFRADDESTLDDKCFNIVEDKQSQQYIRSCSRRHSIDTFMPNSWHSLNQSDFVNDDNDNDHQSKDQLSPVPPQNRQLISDFIKQPPISLTKQLLDQSPDNLTKSAYKFLTSIKSEDESISDQAAQESFEFSGSDIPTQMLCYTTESRESILCNLQSISESGHEEESEHKLVSTQKVKMTIVDSQNLSSQLQFAQKKKIVEDTNVPIFHKLRNRKVEEPKCKTLELGNSDHTQKRSFRMFNDSELGINLRKLVSTDNEELIVDSLQDDDLETDDEVIEAGTQQCFQDLLVMKDWLIHPNERSLKTFKLWAPKFNGQLPRLQN